MKTSKTNIKATLDNVEAFIARLTEADRAAATANDAVEKNQRTLERLTAKRNRSVEDIDAKVMAEHRSEPLGKYAEEQDEAARALVRESAQLLDAAGHVCGAILREIADRRLDTVAAALLPFCANSQRARALAERTDICQAATFSIQRHVGVSNGLVFSNYSSSPALAAARSHVAILKEALKDAPDLLQFLAFKPEEPAA